MEGWQPDPTPAEGGSWNLWNGGQDVDINDPGNCQFVGSPDQAPEIDRNSPAWITADTLRRMQEDGVITREQEREIRQAMLANDTNDLAEIQRQFNISNARGEREFAATLAAQRDQLLADIDHNNRMLAETASRNAADATGWYRPTPRDSAGGPFGAMLPAALTAAPAPMPAATLGGA